MGRFWQGRFHSQALLDDLALLKCMAYVDLNPIRAGKAATLAASKHTSIRARVTGGDRHLVPFIDGNNKAPFVPIWMRSDDYVALVAWTAHAIRPCLDKPPDHPPRALRIAGSGKDWALEIKHYGKRYFRAVGARRLLEHYRQHLGVRWIRGTRHSPAPAGAMP